MSQYGKNYKKAKAKGHITIFKDPEGSLHFNKKQFNSDTGEEEGQEAGVYDLAWLERRVDEVDAESDDINELIKDLKAL